MSAHTPGPWRVEKWNRDLVVNYQPVSVWIGGKQLRIADSPAGDADAALIASAPAMFKAIEEIEWLCDGREDIDNNGGPNLAMQIMAAIRGLKP